MQIGIDARYLDDWQETGLYSRELLAQLARLDQTNHYLLFYRPQAKESVNRPYYGPNFQWEPLGAPGGQPNVGTIRPYFERADQMDRFLHPDSKICAHPAFCRPVIVLHDLPPQSGREEPLWQRLKDQTAEWLRLRQLKTQKTQVMTPSESSKREIIRLMGLDPEQITVVHHGISPVYRPLFDRGSAARIGERYGFQGRYLLYVGGISRHHNLLALFKAFAHLKRDGLISQKLVIAGKLHDPVDPAKSSAYHDLMVAISRSGLSREVVLTGHVQAGPILAELYNGADLFVYPSLHESFSRPPAEAMACGTPVIAGNRSAMPEIIGKGGLLIDVEDEDEIAGAIYQVLGDRTLRFRLARAGLEQAAKYSWERAARETLKVLTA